MVRLRPCAPRPRRPNGRVPEQRHLPEQLAFLHEIEPGRPARRIGLQQRSRSSAPANEVGLSMGVVPLLEDDRAGRVVAPLDVAAGVNFGRSRSRSRGARPALHGQTGVRPRAETALEDPDTAPPRRRRSRATSALVRSSGLVQNVTMVLEIGTRLSVICSGSRRYSPSDRKRAGLVVRRHAHIEKYGIEPSLQEVDDLTCTVRHPCASNFSDSHIPHVTLSKQPAGRHGQGKGRVGGWASLYGPPASSA